MESEQLTLFDEVTETSIEAAYVTNGGEVFLRLVIPRPEQGLRFLRDVVALLQTAGAQYQVIQPDEYQRIYGKYNGQLIVIQVLSNQKYVYNFDSTESE